MSRDLESLALKQGDMLAGKFRVERVLGAGGMGVVVEATHVTLKDRVALKFLRSPRFADDATITRFLREAQAAAKIKSPHVARVVDVGTLENGSPYMVMEFLEGTDLGTLLEQSGVVPMETAVTYVLQTCEALAAAHAARVVHRDIKPSNLFLTFGPDGSPVIKVLDFGISKLLDANSLSGNITETQRTMGSPSYMAPEQMRSARRVDGRADIWSTGVVLYELLTGELPFTAETIPELYALILDPTSVPRPMRAGRENLPEALEKVVLKCLRKDPEERYRNVAELAEALSPFGPDVGPRSVARTRRIIEAGGSRAGIPISSETPGGASHTASLPDSSQPSSGEKGSAGRTATSFSDTRPPQLGGRRKTVIIASAGAAVLGLLVVGQLALQRDPKPALGHDTSAAGSVAPREPPALVAPAPMPIATPASSVVVPAPSASPPPAPSTAAKPVSSVAARPPRPKASVEPSPRPPEDDPMLHRK